MELLTLDAEGWFPVLRQLGVRMPTATIWASVFADTMKPDTFSAGEEDIRNFLPQIIHESARLERMKENLDYDAARICVVWPSRFENEYDARPYEHSPEALANKVYGGRNGNTQPGDGWLYAGRGPLGVTFKDNYVFLSGLMGQDFDVSPQLMEQPHFALEACIGWWESRIPDAMLGHQSSLRKKVNGGQIGIAQVYDLYKDLERITA